MRFKKALCCLLAGSLLGGFALRAPAENVYIATSHDTKPAPEKAVFSPVDFSGYALICETDAMRYYWREDRDILGIENKTNGYALKTGVDLPFSGDAKDLVKQMKKDKLSNEEILERYQPYADDLNTTYVGIANSLISIEYIDSDKTKQISSASEKNAASALAAVEGAENEFVLKIAFSSPEISLNVYFTLTDEGVRYRVPRAEFAGKDLNKLSAVLFTPFLLASGGRMKVLDPESLDWTEKDQYRAPGYVLVPDGSGALIRFADNTSAFNPYIGDVYGKDYATETYYSTVLHDDVPVHDPAAPVFGMAQGDRQLAFVAWADSGAEYMDIVVNPDETKSTSYTWAYPRFEYNVKYYQLYDERGNGFFATLDEPYDYDIDITYRFLFGDGGDGAPAADYIGMARAYRRHLIDTGVLTPKKTAPGDIPLRLDFIMSDSQNGVILTRQITVTTVQDVREILSDVQVQGIRNVNSGLIGWQSKGETLSRPDQDAYSGSVGSKADFERLIRDFRAQGIEISQARNTTRINSMMTNYYGTAVKSVSNWYVSVDESWLLPSSVPINTFGFATPEKTGEWTKAFARNVADYSDAITLSGISSVLNSHWSRNGCETTAAGAARLYADTLGALPMKLNLETPNLYLWKYTDKFLQMPVGNSWFIYESDSVPFLQLVLRDTMEMYAPYANFSFYTQDCILRMIDYNVSPAFILSKEASWNLADSFSSSLYSTEYNLYRDLIRSIYHQVNETLRQAQGYEWINREAVQNGVIVNTYVRGADTLKIVINYTSGEVQVPGATVPAMSAAVIR
ncbi:MAG: hypothetical protein J5472_01435 [Clostridia bacterium]|nr:hypothetical protein [Clostridia bacterium]